MAKATARKASTAKAAKATAAPVEDIDEAEDEAAKAEQEAAKAAQEAALNDLKGRLADSLYELKAADKASAEKARLDWVHIGELLTEGQNMFMIGNGLDKKGFGKWITDNGFTSLGQRPTRAAAIWLANVYNKNPDLYKLFPTESVDGEPLRRSPRTLKDWVREQTTSVFQLAYDNADEFDVPSEVEDKKEALALAKAGMANIYTVIDAELENVEASIADHQRKVTSKDKTIRAAAQKALDDDMARRDRLDTARAIFDAVADEERADMLASWKPKVQTVSFKESAVAEAAEKVFVLLKTHPEFSAVYAALGALVTAHQAKVDADAAAAAKEAQEAANDAGDQDFENDEELEDEAEDEAEDDFEDEDFDDFEEDEDE